MCMYKMGVIGDKDSILGFKALGLSVFPVTQPEQAARLIHRLAKENYAVLFITEQLAKDIQETIDRYNTQPFPIITLIPNNAGSMGLGMKGIKASVEKAVGVDILFGERG
ncbi:V/A-type H+-transporting ATPase subunit F [Caldicoprobacter guelmensis]|nr:V/A-type H+-transporting ATPase subunit F [Caldicoprobacter guelmensis]